MANIITLSRLGLLGLFLLLLCYSKGVGYFVAFFLLILLFSLDAVDGYVARKRHEVNRLGGVLDIAVDRIVEYILWVAFAHLGSIPLVVPLIILIRGVLVDAMRGFVVGQGETPFGMMKTSWGRWVVSSYFMRSLYGVVKTVSFLLLTLEFVVRSQVLFDAGYLLWLRPITLGFVGLTVFLCLVRGWPVLVESRRFFKTHPK
ncbi:MAG: CDP-alcohol phosphatidyltransferase family protein [Deltaproteobacteria bacterium]|nr:CDP-alcohol phosphatidyltransferase family protein [Deltaproteobacteria bacterium]